MSPIMRLLIIGNADTTHIGHHFISAAEEVGVEAVICDTREAWRGPKFLKRISWHFLGKRPLRIIEFNESILLKAKNFRPNLTLVTGIAPVIRSTLIQLGEMGSIRTNFLTDDPWNPSNSARYFWPTLREYDWIFSPRLANIEDLLRFGCRNVHYLPFGFNPSIHYHESCPTESEMEAFACDLAIIGGADRDRYTLALAALNAGFRLLLYGGYWTRHPQLRPFCRGFVYDRALRLAAYCANANLCMGRKANRDGHAMRSLELPAMGACLVVEDTPEHRSLFGADGEAVFYYNSIESMLHRVSELKTQPKLARQLAEQGRKKIWTGKHSYADRLTQMIERLPIK